MEILALKIEPSILAVMRRDAKQEGRSLSGHARYLIKKGMGLNQTAI